MYKLPPNTDIYLNSPYFGLVHSDTMEYRLDAQRKMLENGAQFNQKEGLEESIACKQLIAKSIQSSVADVALVPSFTIAHELLLHSLPKGKIALLKNDYPSIGLPYKYKNWEYTEYELTEGEDYLSQIDSYLASEKPVYFACSHVDYATGILLPLTELNAICDKHKVQLILDATQSYGLNDVDASLSSIAVIMSSSYKWIGAGHGAGFIYISPELQGKMTITVGGANSQVVYLNSSNAKMKSFEPGHADLGPFVGLKKALEIYFEEQDNRWEKVAPLIHRVYVELENKINHGKRNIKYRSALLNLKLSEAEQAKLETAKIQVTFRGGLTRIGIHHYNTLTEIERFLKVLA